MSKQENTELANKLGIHFPDFLLPTRKIDLLRWSVIACDQYTSEPDYWQQVEELVGDNPSTLKLMLPEVYLENETENDINLRMKNINATMQEYLSAKILKSSSSAMLLVDRKTPLNPSRKGLLLAIDLEKYDFTPGSQNFIRATEKTVAKRIEARLKIREQAPIELPHVLLLFDDPKKTVIEPIAKHLAKTPPFFETDLMFDGGHIRAWKIYQDKLYCTEILQALSKLERFQKDGFLFASGDGNHSLATAKTHWENIKKTLHVTDHPARYTLVEICNIYDSGLSFEPIHRVLKHASLSDFTDFAQQWIKTNIPQLLNDEVKHVNLRQNDQIETLAVPLANQLVITHIQALLDDYISTGKSHDGKDLKIDYIHGNKSLLKLAQKGYITIELPAIDKNTFFDYLVQHHTLPRKTFSIGEAFEKRYYLECRKIIK